MAKKKKVERKAKAKELSKQEDKLLRYLISRWGERKGRLRFEAGEKI